MGRSHSQPLTNIRLLEYSSGRWEFLLKGVRNIGQIGNMFTDLKKKKNFQWFAVWTCDLQINVLGALSIICSHGKKIVCRRVILLRCKLESGPLPNSMQIFKVHESMKTIGYYAGNQSWSVRLANRTLMKNSKTQFHLPHIHVHSPSDTRHVHTPTDILQSTLISNSSLFLCVSFFRLKRDKK